MKRVFLLLVLLLTSLSSYQVFAQDNDADCDPVASKEWLVSRQSWINATEDVLNAQGLSIADAQMHLHNHLQAIEDLPRPKCAADLMLMTYYFYDQVQHLLICAQQNDGACVTDMQNRVANYRSNVGAVLEPLASLAGFSTLEYMSLRPEGWSISGSPVSPPAADVGTESANSEDSGTGIVSTANGTRTDPIPLGQFYKFEDGRVRVLSVTDPYIPDPQSYSSVPETSRVVAVEVEYVCEISNPDESCSSLDVLLSAMVSDDGTVYDNDAMVFVDANDHFYGQEAFGGNVLKGRIYFGIPAVADFTVMRFYVNFSSVFFSPR